MFNTQCRWRSLVIMMVGMTGWVMGTAAASTRNQSSPSDVPSSAYEHAQALIALPGGRRLNLFCMGAGTPVVILEAGGGDDSLTFRRVQGRLSAFTRVCSYDRAGMGFSDPSDAPNTAAHTVRDLHALVDRADIPKPFVLVGHSDGGLYASLYAAYFPDEVSGLVMIDPNNLGLDMAAEKVLDQPWLKEWRTSNLADIKQARHCLVLAKQGALASALARYPKCMDNPPNPDVVLHRRLDKQLARPSEQEALLTEMIDTYPKADGGLANAELTLRDAHFDFCDKPLIVLSGTNEQDELPPAELAKVTKAMLANQADLAAHSTKGKQLLVSSKTEYIQTYHPDVVVRSVTEIVEEVRKQFTEKNVKFSSQKN